MLPWAIIPTLSFAMEWIGQVARNQIRLKVAQIQSKSNGLGFEPIFFAMESIPYFLPWNPSHIFCHGMDPGIDPKYFPIEK